MNIYKVKLGEDASLAQEWWFFKAGCLLAAVQMAEDKKKRERKEWRGWDITSTELIGYLEEGAA